MFRQSIAWLYVLWSRPRTVSVLEKRALIPVHSTAERVDWLSWESDLRIVNHHSILIFETDVLWSPSFETLCTCDVLCT